jgi:uncharacterized heparinase superfamily protein
VWRQLKAIDRAALYVRTGRHLRPRQVAFQLLRRIVPARSAPRPKVQPTARLPNARGSFIEPAATGENLGPQRFRFCGLEKDFGSCAVDWACADMPRLWRYHLHYFDWMLDPSRPPESLARLTRDWLANNPPGTKDAWDPYPLSLRVVNWVKYALSVPASLSQDAAWLESLWSQSAWLYGNLEYHILANHLFKNVKALLFAGAFFDDRDARRWRRTGEELLLEQLVEQFLPDGGHFERSPMYHAILTEDLLDLLELEFALPGSLAPESIVRLIAKARDCLTFLADMLHPDGEISLFNDSAIGGASAPSRIFRYGSRIPGIAASLARPENRIVRREESGYFGWQGLRDAWLLDCGPLSVDYQPGHGHCDLLSYELSFSDRRVVVDRGVFDYQLGPRREYARSTTGHNTVVVDHQEQSELWGVFRVGRRAHPLWAKLQFTEGELCFDGAHDGYMHLPGKVIHRRVARYLVQGRLEITDILTGSGTHIMDNFIHLAPGLTVERTDLAIKVRDPAGVGVVSIHTGSGVDVIIESDEYYPEFGRVDPAVRIRLHSSGALPIKQSYSIERC